MAGVYLLKNIFKGINKPILNGQMTKPTFIIPFKNREVEQLGNIGKSMLESFYRSDNYLDRLRAAGIWRAPLKRQKVIDQLVSNTKNSKIIPVKDIPLKGTNAANVKGVVAGVSYKKLPNVMFDKTGRITKVAMNPSVIKINTGVTLPAEQRLGTIEHELLHASTDNSNGLGSTLEKIKVINPITKNPQTFRINKDEAALDDIMEYNKRLMEGNMLSKEQYIEALKQRNPNAPEEALQPFIDKYTYITSPQEWRARGLQLNLEARRHGQSLVDYIKSNPTRNTNFADMRKYATPQQIYNYASRALSLATPIGLGAYLMNNKSDNIV